MWRLIGGTSRLATIGVAASRICTICLIYLTILSMVVMSRASLELRSYVEPTSNPKWLILQRLSTVHRTVIKNLLHFELTPRKFDKYLLFVVWLFSYFSLTITLYAGYSKISLSSLDCLLDRNYVFFLFFRGAERF